LPEGNSRLFGKGKVTEGGKAILPGMDDKTKQILLKLVDDMQDLRATVGAIAASASRPISAADAQDAKILAKLQDRQRYDELRKEIES